MFICFQEAAGSGSDDDNTISIIIGSVVGFLVLVIIICEYSFTDWLITGDYYRSVKQYSTETGVCVYLSEVYIENRYIVNMKKDISSESKYSDNHQIPQYFGIYKTNFQYDLNTYIVSLLKQN